MKKSQSGFTLIELVVVIVLLGILGVTALGKFQDLSVEADAAAIEGVASEISAAASINYAKGLVSGTFPETLSAANICTTALLQDLFAAGSFPGDYDVDETTAGNCSGGVGNTATCTIFKDNGASANDGVMDADETVRATASIACTD